MPSVCAASCPAPLMCTGVIAITPIITTFPTAMALTPRRAAECDITNLSAGLIPGLGVSVVVFVDRPSSSRATTAGSGRRNTSSSTMASVNRSAEKK